MFSHRYYPVLTQSCETLAGIGPALASKLKQCGIHTLQDLLFHLPYRYQDRTHITPIQDLRANDWCVVVGRVCKTEIKQGRRRMLYCYVEDKTGLLTLRFFHFNKQQIQNLNEAHLIRAFGEVREFGNRLELIHPEYQLLKDLDECVVEDTLTPIYPTTQGLSQTRIRQLIKQALTHCHHELATMEWMSAEQLENHSFSSMQTAIEQLHYPPPEISLNTLNDGSHPALKRIVFDELFAQHLSLQFARQKRSMDQAMACSAQNDLVPRFLAQLPFKLTEAQQRVHLEIQRDLSQNKPMLRLLQGDVGSGKTVIAALAALQAIAEGHQVALMAPTEILSEQHAQTLSNWLAPLGILVHQLSGKMKAKVRREVLEALIQKECCLIVGTHALFQKDVIFAQLGLIIIDEQHRFGVEQRLLLQQKGKNNQHVPHQLLMTATPIPRTLAMTAFSHLDLSSIDELPPGRTPITTAVIHQSKRELIIDRLQRAIASGRQAYWVCTLIDDSESLQCKAAIESAQYLQEQLPNVRIGLVHGRMKANEKEAVMVAFKKGDIQLLVATTVIEVGVDVPNASLMIIENSERLGLSQLHQLRGRVGRGSHQSHCLLLYQSPLSLQSRERLSIMRSTTDGFIIAEQDLKLRGAGEVLGTRQAGFRRFKVAELPRDQALLLGLKPMAKELLQQNPSLAHSIANRWYGTVEAFLRS